MSSTSTRVCARARSSENAATGAPAGTTGGVHQKLY
jgi:hypothetical protein